MSSKVYRDTAFGPQNLKLSASEVELRTIECLSVTELLDKAESPSNALSLGQTQKLAFAGMLAVDPDILILDEATALLDPLSRSNLYEILLNLNRHGKTIIHITHDLQAVKQATQVIGLDQGKIFYNGKSRDFLADKSFVKRISGDPLKKRGAGAGVRTGAGAGAGPGEKSLVFENLSFSYPGKIKKSQTEEYFINKLSFCLYKGSLTALTGPSGAGKSTLLELGAGLLEPDGGKIYCSQKPALAQQNASAALFEAFAADDVAFAPRNQGVKGRELIELVKSSMDRAGLPFSIYGERQSAGLSGGEQRRLALAGILAMNREIVFFDEPTAGLDGISRYRVMQMMRSLADEGKTVLFTTHHQDEADFADREIKIEKGRVIADSGIAGDEAGTDEGATGVAEPVQAYDAASMLKGLKAFSMGLSGSGWKTKCLLEKLPAFLRILIFLALFVLSLLARNTVFCGCMVLLSAIYCLFANFSLKKIIKSLLKILPFLCFFAIFQIVFRPALADEIRYTSWRFFTITPSKLWFCLNSILRTYSSLLCVCGFFVSTPEYDLIDGLKKLLPFKNLILILELIFRFIPLLVDEAADIIKTQIIRGGLGKVKGKLAKIKAVIPLIVPLIIRTVKRSEILADAIVMRCFNEK